MMKVTTIGSLCQVYFDKLEWFAMKEQKELLINMINMNYKVKTF
jgi:hypothetical protein